MIDRPIVHIVASLDEATAGPTYSVARLTSCLADAGARVHIETLGEPAIALSPKVRVHAHEPLKTFGHLRPAPTMRRSLQVWSDQPVIFHNHGLWLMPNAYAAWVAGRGNVKLVVSPRGMLSIWALAHHRLRKRVAWWLLAQRRLMARASAFHATAECEAEDIRRLGYRQPIYVIPNGIDMPPPPPDRARSDGRRQLLFMSRIHPKKGIDLLLRSWAGLEGQFPNWDLIIAGPDEAGHAAEMKQLAQRLGLRRVTFPGAIHGIAKRTALYNADLFVLPTHSENFGLVVAEALAHGAPVITTTGAPWSGLKDHECGWWVDRDMRSFQEVLKLSMSCDSSLLKSMGMNGRAWMSKKFSWVTIADSFRRLYVLVSEAGQQDMVHGIAQNYL